MTFREVMKRLGIWTKAQKDTYRELAMLTDNELKDIGLSRNDILELIREMED